MKLLTIKKVYNELNETQFNNALTMPRILIKRWRDTVGQHIIGGTKNETILEFNLRKLKYSTARSVIYHEMVHQYLEDVLSVTEKNDHGEIFWLAYKWFAIHSDVELSEDF